MLAWLALIPLGLLTAGLLRRRRRHVHGPLMAAAFLSDVGLLLLVEWQRHVIDIAVESGGRRPMLDVHIGFSVLTLCLYAFLVASGLLQWRRTHAFHVHRHAAVVFVVCRVGGFVTSFLV
jgi:uncharacterized membrane protein YozB (DUF420 family)